MFLVGFVPAFVVGLLLIFIVRDGTVSRRDFHAQVERLEALATLFDDSAQSVQHLESPEITASPATEEEIQMAVADLKEILRGE